LDSKVLERDQHLRLARPGVAEPLRHYAHALANGLDPHVLLRDELGAVRSSTSTHTGPL
jgi:hypothetical protein